MFLEFFFGLRGLDGTQYLFGKEIEVGGEILVGNGLCYTYIGPSEQYGLEGDICDWTVRSADICGQSPIGRPNEQ